MLTLEEVPWNKLWINNFICLFRDLVSDNVLFGLLCFLPVYSPLI